MSRITCNKCRKRNKCKEPCKKIENYLQRKDLLAHYSLRHIRRMEAPYMLSSIEYLAWQKKNKSKHTPPRPFDDNFPYYFS